MINCKSKEAKTSADFKELIRKLLVCKKCIIVYFHIFIAPTLRFIIMFSFSESLQSGPFSRNTISKSSKRGRHENGTNGAYCILINCL